jgi:DNA-directed RNA polymerase specialized sigma subunit
MATTDDGFRLIRKSFEKAAMQRRAKVRKAHDAGRSFLSIAQELGISRQRVSQLYRQALKDWNK